MEFYLQELRQNLRNASETSTILVVLGNESCDLDSAISSIVFAYFLNKVKKTVDIIVPVLNVKRKDLPLHTEVVYFLEETGFQTSDLICIDEIDLKTLNEKGKLSIALVDHNTLSHDQKYLQSRVTQIVDHHSIENAEEIQKINKKIEPVGSCCTLIAEEVINSNISVMDPQVAMLLYGTILLDTVCLKESAKRATEKDKEVVAALEKVLGGPNRDEVFQELQKVKFDTSKLTPEQLLYKDTKYIFDNNASIAIASLPRLLSDIILTDSFVSALKEMTSLKNLQSVILMGLEVKDSQAAMRRQIAVYDTCSSSLENISNYLRSLENPSLNLLDLSVDSNCIKLFEQENVTLTRKFVLPAMQCYFRSSSSDNSDVKNIGMSSNENNEGNSFDIANNGMGDFCDPVIPTYQAETLDFPDSPNHSILLGKSAIMEESFTSIGVNGIPEPDEIDAGRDIRASEGSGTLKRISVHPSVLETKIVEEDQRSLSSLSNRSDLDAFSQSDDIVLEDDAATFEDLDNSDCLDSPLSDPIPEMSAAEEFEEERSWRTCVVNGEDKKIDMKVIEPYRKVLSHGGYEGSTRNAIIVFSACYLPDRSRKDYCYVMDNLFLYVIVTLDELVAEDYVLVYLHGATDRGNMPSFSWLKRCYQMIDRRLRKNLKGLYLVHPTFWLKTIVIMTRPFISSKFTRKLKFVYSLKELSSLIPLDQVCIPDKVKQLDFERSMREYMKEMNAKKLISSPLYITYIESLYANS